MTHEDRAKLIIRTFLVVLATGIVAAVYFYPESKENNGKAATSGKPEAPDNRLRVVHYHQPGDPSSEQLADVLNNIQKKYDKYVNVSRVDIKKSPELAKAQGVTKTPHVIVFSGNDKIYEFQGPATQAQVERKMEEILRGLKRIDKDWRPPVPGMKAAGK